jgi:hypothetical protein
MKITKTRQTWTHETETTTSGGMPSVPGKPALLWFLDKLIGVVIFVLVAYALKTELHLVDPQPAKPATPSAEVRVVPALCASAGHQPEGVSRSQLRLRSGARSATGSKPRT